MVPSALFRFVFLLFALTLAQASQAADKYCATRRMPQQEGQCFDTLAQAESYIRTEPATPIGNAMLERVVERRLDGGTFLYEYAVKPRAADSFVGDFYQATYSGTKMQCTNMSPGGVLGPDNQMWCDDETSLKQSIIDSWYYSGTPYPGLYSGIYNLSTPVTWNAGGSGYVAVDRNADPERRVYGVNVNGHIDYWPVNRVDWFRCPALFTSMHPNPGVQWPKVCNNGSYGQIAVKSVQYDSCCKDGNPAVAATGNKEYRDSDFLWEGGDFGRAYNSIRDFSLQSGLGDNWAHSFSTRLLIYDGWPNTWIRSDGYYETMNGVAEGGYRSLHREGVIIIREPDARAATLGRWRLSTASGELLWFDESGRLVSFDRGGNIFRLDYCTESDVQSGACLAVGNLARVRSPLGRALTFQYVAATTPVAGDLGVRIARILADGAVQVEYVYDTLGRLTHASKGGAAAGEGPEYLYAEASHLCRNATGVVIAGCNASLYPYLLTGVIDENGSRYATYDYDELERVTISDHAGGAGKVTLAYVVSGPTTVTLPTGATKVYSFSSGFRNPEQIAYSTTDGSTIAASTARYSEGRRDWNRTAAGARTNYTYNSFQQISRKEGLDQWGGETALTRTIQTDWLLGYSIPTERRVLNNTNALVAKSQWTYNDRGQVLTSTQIDPATGESRVVTTTYCEAADVTAGICPLVGLVKSVDGPRTDVADITTYTYRAADDPACSSAPATCAYRKGDLWKVTNAAGHVAENLRYDFAGRLLSSKNPNGVVTDFEYTPRGWLQASKVRGANAASEADDAITRYEYDLIGQVKKVTQPDGVFVRYDYDTAHRLTDIYDSAGNRIHYTLDNAGNRTKEDTSDTSGNLKRTLSRIYNQLGQLKTAKTAYDHPTDFTYDASGNGDVTTDALGRKADNDYDPLNRLAKTLQDVGGINAKSEFKYDALDRLTKVTDPKGLDTTYGYNGFGDQVQLKSPDTGTSTFTYDSAGNRKTETDARGITRVYGYDLLNRVVSVSYPTTSLNVGYTYDSVPAVCLPGETFTVGRLTLMTDSSGTTQYCYDRLGRTARKVQTTNGKIFAVGYTYTLAGQLSSVTYPDGAIVSYQRDAQGRISQIDTKRGVAGASTETLLSQVTYHPFGPTAGWAYGNGRTMARPVDLDYRTIAVHDPAAGGLSFGFGFDAVDNIDKLTQVGTTNALLIYGYDALNRLSSLRDGPTNTAIESYAYDATGNRLSVTTASGTKTYTYPVGSHRLAQAGSDGSRNYDASGNSIQIGSNTFVYNEAGRSSELKQGSTLVQTYLYNGRGEQLRKYTAATERYMLYDESGRWLGEYDGNANVIQQLIWMDELPIGLLVGNGAQQTLHYIEPDHLGTPRVIVDPVRNVTVWNWDLKGEAFGNSPPNPDSDQDGVLLQFDLRFPGQIYDGLSGLNYNVRRDYDARVGRYAQSDPIGLQAGVSTYSYVESSPMTGVDPTGMFSMYAFQLYTGEWRFRFRFHQSCLLGNSPIDHADNAFQRLPWLGKIRKRQVARERPTGDVDAVNKCACRAFDSNLSALFDANGWGAGSPYAGEAYSESQAAEMLSVMRQKISSLNREMGKDCDKCEMPWESLIGKAKARGVPYIGNGISRDEP
ncbi:RHS repeat-associated core domain-containing protein [Lysobacter gummosus]|uniref:RHS repeat protein n=1 Tax=Lysobacter gummosus TaxID=262324 RepID=A0ABY3XGJ2_9GAMM|nr:RHS repeat-associated core domain-containing protein [Lysobacter gummosus]ALN90190.1 RHS repeat-associated core domain protein [Lysobacter gummosus]UNP30744.1 RHS repeat protein [Lysobacter gummosus]